jgi:branched-chain amino acid transport system substrate-binding protein
MRKFIIEIIFAAMILVFSLTASTQASSSTTQGVLKVGYNSALTGAAAAWGIPFHTTGQMYADKVNAEGGLLVGGKRYKIELVIEDCKYDVAVTRSVTEKLLNSDNVKYIISMGDPMVTVMDPMMTQAKAIWIGVTTNYDMVTREHPWIFTVHPDHVGMAQGLVKMMSKYEPQVKSFYSVGINLQFDKEQAHPAQRKAFEAAGIKFLGSTFYEPGTTDFAPLATAAVNKRPDLVVMGIIGADSVGMIKTLREYGYTGPIASYSALGTEAIVKGLSGVGKYAERFYDEEFDWYPFNAEEEQLRTEYVKRTGNWVEGVPLYYYNLQLLCKAIQDAGSITDTDKVRRALENVRLTDEFFPGKPEIHFGGLKTYGHRHSIVAPVGLITVKGGKPVGLEVIIPDVP